MSSQSLLTSSHMHCMQQRQAPLDYASIPAPFGPTRSLLPTSQNRLNCLSSLGSLERSLSGSLSDAQKLTSSAFRGRGSHHGRAGHGLTICRSGPTDESQQLGDRPLEPPRPGFSREPHSSLSYIPADDPAAAPLPPKKIKINTRRGGRQRRWKKATPIQAIGGAMVAGLWAALALKGTILAYEHLDSHPLVQKLPLGMTKNVNQLLMTGVTGFGAFAVLMFSVCSFGLALLTLKLLSAPKTPLK